MNPLPSLGYPLAERTLSNGMRVIVSSDHGAPVVAVNLWYNVGSRDERAGETGLAHLFEHVMFQGSENVGSGEHLAAMQAAGGSVNATTSFDRTNYFEAVPSGALDLALWLEADRLATLPQALTTQNLDNQRDVVKEEKRQRYDNVPYGDVLLHLLTLTFPPGHPYAHPVIGSMADLDAATAESAKDFFTRFYAPANCTLTLVGDIDPDTGFARAEHYFGAIPSGDRNVRPPMTVLRPMESLARHEVRAAVPASALYLTWRLPAAGTREFDACGIALDVLGGGQTSRLFRRLVRDDRSASAAGASALGLAGGNSIGFAFARSLDGEGLDALEKSMLEELDRLAAEGPTDDELGSVRVQFEREWLSQLARVDGRADLFNMYATLYGSPGLVNTRIADFTSITADEVAHAISTWLRPEARAALTYYASEK